MEMLIISGIIGVIIGDALKEEIFRLSQQTKPKPRKRRGKA